MQRCGARQGAGRRPSWKVGIFYALGGIAWTGMMLGPVSPVFTPAFAQTAPPPVPAPAPVPVATASDDQPLTQAQLEQLLAPIALYPDSLLMQVLMASTYPLEVVQAKRWLGQGQNAALRGDALAQALVAQSWDPSVKSLVPFADVLTTLSDQLEWTQQLGDAVLAQQDDVMNAVQALRGRAQAAGQLQSGPQQTVTVVQNVAPAAPASGGTAVVPPPPQVITIEPAQPEQVAVPVYNPSVVYGAWPYPANPPVYYPPPPAYGVGTAILTGMAFAGTVAVASSLWGWARPGWGRGNVDIDVNRYNNINVNRNQISNNSWRHDESHRHGVAYRNDNVRNRVGAGPGGRAGGQDRSQAREQFRGRADTAQRGGGLGGGDRPNLGNQRPGGGGGDRPNLGGQRPGGGGGDRPNLGNQRPGGGGGDRPNLGGQRPGGGGGDRPNLGGQRPGGGGGDRPNLGDRNPGGAGNRPAVAHRPDGRPQTTGGLAGRADRQGPQGLQGVGGQGNRERAAASRGMASRQGQPAARERAQQRQAPAMQRGGGGGGGMRGGGGGHGGGRRH